MKEIAVIHSDYKEKFGIPRQSGLVPESTAEIVFLPEYRRAEAVRGLEGYSHIWLIWEFSLAKRSMWSPTVRPPRLGGNKRMGVFATRSPFRPNPIGLSSVRLERIVTDTHDSPVLIVSGADLLDGTPIYDIKPYIRAYDCHIDAEDGFAGEAPERRLTVEADEKCLAAVAPDKRAALLSVLSRDPRPSYQHDPDRVYGFAFSDFEVKFRVDGDVLTLLSVSRRGE